MLSFFIFSYPDIRGVRMKSILYNRDVVAEYAYKWAFRRNPEYYNFDSIGGDCTNFVSQCIFAGAGVMNYTDTFWLVL